MHDGKGGAEGVVATARVHGVEEALDQHRHALEEERQVLWRIRYHPCALVGAWDGAHGVVGHKEATIVME